MSESNDPMGYEMGQVLELGGSEPYVSPTLEQLPKGRRPQTSTVCERCPASVWYASATVLKCYCRVLHLHSWTTEDQNAMTHCDGQVMAMIEHDQAKNGELM